MAVDLTREQRAPRARTPVVVLGMHRSGTSAVARVVNLLGATLGDPAQVDAYYEHMPLQDCNERLLWALGGGWDGPPRLVPGFEDLDAAKALRPHAHRLLASVTDAPFSVWKDPRTCLTLPFWRSLFPAEPIVVFVARNPIEVAASLHTRDGFGRYHALALWERYTGDALRNATGLPTVVVHYERLLSDPVEETAKLRDTFVEWGVAGLAAATVAARELDRGAHHERAVDGADSMRCTASQTALCDVVAALPARSDTFTTPAIPVPDANTVELLAAHAEIAYLRHESQSRRSLATALVRRTREEIADRFRRDDRTESQRRADRAAQARRVPGREPA